MNNPRATRQPESIGVCGTHSRGCARSEAAASDAVDLPAGALDMHSPPQVLTHVSSITDGSSNVAASDELVPPNPVSHTTPAPLSQPIGFFSHAHNFVQRNCQFVEVHGNYIVYRGLEAENLGLHSVMPIDAPAYKRCPPATHLFTGRQKLLDEMENYFLEDIGSRHVCVLHGLGGVGKTQIAYRFVETCTKNLQFSHIFLIDVSTVDTIKTDLANIALSQKIGSSVEDAQRWLSNETGRWLILFNNADDVTLNLSTFFPLNSHGNILITTRNPQLCIHTRNGGFKVQGLGEEEATELLLSMIFQNDSVTRCARDQATAIVKELSRHPLAVVQAGAYIAQNQNLRGYLELYKRHRTQLWQTQPVQRHDEYQWTVYTTWQMSVDLLRPEAVTFLRICAFIHYEGISENLFRAASFAAWPGPSYDAFKASPEMADFFGRFMSPSGDWDGLLFWEMVTNVRSYSLINFDGANNVFSIHPLVHTWMRTTVADGDLSTRNGAQYLLGLSIALSQQLTLHDSKARSSLQPHVDAALKYDQDDDTETPPALLEVFALVYLHNGRLGDAEKLQFVVVDGNTRLLGEDHPTTLDSLDRLAMTYFQQGRFEDARKLRPEMEAASMRVLSDACDCTQCAHECTEEVLCYIANQAMMYSRQNRYDLAERLQLAVMRRNYQRIQGSDDSDPLSRSYLLLMLGNTANLVTTYVGQGRDEEAEKLQLGLVAEMKRMLGDEHLYTLESVQRLSEMHQKRNRLSEAERLQTAMTESRRKILGEDHPDTLDDIVQLAKTYVFQGRYTEGEELLVSALEASKRVFGSDHPKTVMYTGWLAATYIYQARYEEAKDLQLTVVEASRRVFGDHHYYTQVSRAVLFVIPIRKFWLRWKGVLLGSVVVCFMYILRILHAWCSRA
ncbi:hypothetical protein FPV67DRAFT_674744 [Lyophyllum atratum]|nr:hypothetical protein FPV67DRAFT_674744 [Lyophyllum atratum]